MMFYTDRSRSSIKIDLNCGGNARPCSVYPPPRAYWRSLWHEPASAEAPFTLQSLDDQPLASSRQVRIFHGFGPATLTWRGRTCSVTREQTIAP